ncbi:hypothetical protein JTE90_028527 [Oedothorax gibbosus]|uniref:Uncharacterized protein n=1 Tax=Oedothorax gibbosus TaxID=931172 RepID=A0AAV6VW92_9ARAC|nr:hypothetical protein JTE90_028527 [Oedothorax gibbosus]
MRSGCFYLMLLAKILTLVNCQNTASNTPRVLELFPDDRVADVLLSEDESVDEDDAKTVEYDDEVNRIHIPIDPIVGQDDATYEKTHHPPDHRFKLISLDNIVHLNPAWKVSIWLLIGGLVKVAMNFDFKIVEFQKQQKSSTL